MGLSDGFVFDLHGVPARDVVRRLLPDGLVEEGLRLVNDYWRLPQGRESSRGPELSSSLPRSPARVSPWTVVTLCTRTLAETRAGAAGTRLPAVTMTADDARGGSRHRTATSSPP